MICRCQDVAIFFCMIVTVAHSSSRGPKNAGRRGGLNITPLVASTTGTLPSYVTATPSISVVAANPFSPFTACGPARYVRVEISRLVKVSG